LLDIKPQVPDFAAYTVDHVGWLEQARDKLRLQKADSRFR